MARSNRSQAHRRQDVKATTPRKVLVLDDHEAVRSVVGRVLHEHGFVALNASSVTEAARLLATTPVAAMILDVKLPGGESGLDLLARIREQPLLASVPAVVMTGVVLSEADRQKVHEHRAHLLHKPAGLTALVGFLHGIAASDPPAEL